MDGDILPFVITQLVLAFFSFLLTIVAMRSNSVALSDVSKEDYIRIKYHKSRWTAYSYFTLPTRDTSGGKMLAGGFPRLFLHGDRDSD